MSGESLIRRGLSVGTAAFAQATQALTSLGLAMLAARLLGLEALGEFSIIYGGMVLAAALTSGFVGDTLTVLDRSDPSIRGGLAAWTVLIVVAVSATATSAAWITNFLGPVNAILFGVATACFMLEDLVRRQHMACMTFARLIWIDSLVFVVSIGVVVGGVLNNDVSLTLFLAALCIGQLVGASFGWLIVPRTEHHRMGRPVAWAAVARYGAWRAAQQGLRPGLQTSMKITVTAFISLAAAGLLESARIYAAPAMILTGGIFSFMFPYLAKGRSMPLSQQLRQTDRAVLRVVLITLFCSVVALVALPWAGPMVTGTLPSAVAICGWLAYTLTVGAATPYGLLAAVREYPRQVFTIRSMDTVLSFGLVMVVVVTGADYRWVPWAAALGSAAGGVLLRRLVLRRLADEATDPRPAPVNAAPVATMQFPLRPVSNFSIDSSSHLQVTRATDVALRQGGKHHERS